MTVNKTPAPIEDPFSNFSTLEEVLTAPSTPSDISMGIVSEVAAVPIKNSALSSPFTEREPPPEPTFHPLNVRLVEFLKTAAVIATAILIVVMLAMIGAMVSGAVTILLEASLGLLLLTLLAHVLPRDSRAYQLLNDFLNVVFGGAKFCGRELKSMITKPAPTLAEIQAGLALPD